MAGPSTGRGLGESTTRPHGGDRSRFRRRAGLVSNIFLVYSPVGRRAFSHSAGNERPSQPGLGKVVSSSFSGISSSWLTRPHHLLPSAETMLNGNPRRDPISDTHQANTRVRDNVCGQSWVLDGRPWSWAHRPRREEHTALEKSGALGFSRGICGVFVALGRFLKDFVRLGYLHFPIGNPKSATFWSKSAKLGWESGAL